MGALIRWTPHPYRIIDVGRAWVEADGAWKRVVIAAECEPCEWCEEPVCYICDEHYATCDCPGPTQDEMEYKEINGVMYAREDPDE